MVTDKHLEYNAQLIQFCMIGENSVKLRLRIKKVRFIFLQGCYFVTTNIIGIIKNIWNNVL